MEAKAAKGANKAKAKKPSAVPPAVPLSGGVTKKAAAPKKAAATVAVVPGLIRRGGARPDLDAPAPRDFSTKSMYNLLRLGGVHTCRLDNKKAVEFAAGLASVYKEPIPEMTRHLAAVIEGQRETIIEGRRAKGAKDAKDAKGTPGDAAKKKRKGKRLMVRDMDYAIHRVLGKRLVGKTDVENEDDKQQQGQDFRFY